MVARLWRARWFAQALSACGRVGCEGQRWGAVRGAPMGERCRQCASWREKLAEGCYSSSLSGGE